MVIMTATVLSHTYTHSAVYLPLPSQVCLPPFDPSIFLTLGNVFMLKGSPLCSIRLL
jgi:hypothetical protein